MNSHTDGQKSALPYDYPPLVANSSWLFDKSQTLVAHFTNHLQRQSQYIIAMRFSLKFSSTMGGTWDVHTVTLLQSFYTKIF